MTHLFQAGDFTLRSGAKSSWRIECDGLTPEDWEGLARIASEVLPPFRYAEGVPRGGVPFAIALGRYATGDETHPVLICEDVCTTGGSMERFRSDYMTDPYGLSAPMELTEFIGVCAFARGPAVPRWVTPLFRMPAPQRQDQVSDALTIPVAGKRLGLTTRVQTALAIAGVATVGDLIQKTADELMDGRNFGRMCLKEVASRLGELGLCLRDWEYDKVGYGMCRKL